MTSSTILLIAFTSLSLSETATKNPAVVKNDEQTKKTILDLFDKQVAAWNEGNLEKFMATYWKSPKLTFSAGGKTTRGWKETLARYKKSYSTRELMGHLTFSKFEVHVLGENSALALGNWQLKRSNDTLQGNFSVVLKKMDGKWLIIHDHSSSLDDEKE